MKKDDARKFEARLVTKGNDTRVSSAATRVDHDSWWGQAERRIDTWPPENFYLAGMNRSSQLRPSSGTLDAVPSNM